MKGKFTVSLLLAFGAFLLLHQVEHASSADPQARDPGVRSGPADAGGPLDGLTGTELAYFTAGKDDFSEAEEVPEGLGPTMNLDSCLGCHSQPATGGSSPAPNPQIAFAKKRNNRIPSFIRSDGPVREVRFVRNPDGTLDGGVHALFSIAGRSDAPGCVAQPDYETQYRNNNVIFRIPTPLFGAGLIEQIPDKAILANQASSSAQKRALGIRGRPNIVVPFQTISGQTNNNGNDGTYARFGWKAQNKSLLLFSGEAYNVEMGITNELFQTERDESCQFATSPNSVTNTNAHSAIEALSSIEKFAFFMRFLKPPTRSLNAPGGVQSIARGQQLFSDVGCAYCHTPAMQTVKKAAVAALSDKPVNLYSDLMLHDMGTGLADGVKQGTAGAREFRTAPLWGLGQRIFFLHDGRTADLLVAIREHQSSGSEANGVVQRYNALSEADRQHLLNFLRSL